VKNSRTTYAHKSLVLNEHYSGDPPVLDKTKVQNTITIDRMIVRPQYRETAEALHLAQGGTLGRVHKGLLTMRAQGRILVPDATQMASMEDMEKELRLAFDPYECYRDSLTTDGVYALSWLEPTLNTTNYPTGWMNVSRYVRPVRQPETEWTVNDQSNRRWSVILEAPDPRLYDTTLASSTVTTPFSSTNLVNYGTIASPLRVTITMAGAGASNFTITRGGVSFILNLAGMVNNDVVVAVMETSALFGTGRSVTKNGAAAFSLKTSTYATWLDVPAGTTAFTHTNTTNVTSIVYAWGHARP